MHKVISRFDQFVENAKSVRMRSFERYIIRERLITQMEEDMPSHTGAGDVQSGASSGIRGPLALLSILVFFIGALVSGFLISQHSDGASGPTAQAETR